MFLLIADRLIIIPFKFDHSLTIFQHICLFSNTCLLENLTLRAKSAQLGTICKSEIALFPGAWAKDAIAYSEHCDRPSCPGVKPGDRPIKAMRSPNPSSHRKNAIAPHFLKQKPHALRSWHVTNSQSTHDSPVLTQHFNPCLRCLD